MQRHFGSLKMYPTVMLTVGVDTRERIKSVGRELVDNVFFEVGTGRAAITLAPITLAHGDTAT